MEAPASLTNVGGLGQLWLLSRIATGRPVVMGPLSLLYLAVGVSLASARLPTPWTVNSWETVPIFAFPGCSPTFMNDTQAAYFANSFSNLLIWGVNATCLGEDGTTFPPTCASSTCYCNRSNPESQTWVLNMETSLAAQAAAIKAASSSGRAQPM